MEDISIYYNFPNSIFFFKDTPNAAEKAIGIALAESIIKIIFYYFHERLWIKVNFNIKTPSVKRHLFKTITWRIIASITTFLLTLLIFKDDPNTSEKATGVMIVETIFKMGFYYTHERAWHKTDFGINR
ncbi:MAG: DUF2061 domain-containing protein [Flavobacteriales bacterium]|nr:DUF2061 domain-containing protein [Flavobacteriales bacterium]